MLGNVILKVHSVDPKVRAQVSLFWEVCDLDATRLEVWAAELWIWVLDIHYTC